MYEFSMWVAFSYLMLLFKYCEIVIWNKHASYVTAPGGVCFVSVSRQLIRGILIDF